ncbi:MAG: hypothetical protein IT209_11920 [Armatimonadetes bacterium]|nr:hypothetical protein [Armatimonadota bacterium]
MSAMTGRERILATLKGERPDKIGRTESLWSETVWTWQSQGLPAGDMADTFSWDFGGLPGPDMSLMLPPEIIEETSTYVHQRDTNGVERKDWKMESGHTPHWLSHTVNNGADWLAYRDRLTPDAIRLNPTAMETYTHLRDRGRFIHWTSCEAYECAWPVFGQVNIFTMMMEEPETLADVFTRYTDLIISLAQQTLDAGIDFDGAFFYGDVGYRNGLLFSPKIYDALLFPAHQKMCAFFNGLGKPVILHSCGQIKSLIPRFIEAGFSAIQPLEAKCNQDIRELRELHGRQITFFGNMDVRALSGTRDDIRAEVMSKLEASATEGSYIFHSDHSLPPTVSLENYKFALEVLDEFNNQHFGN